MGNVNLFTDPSGYQSGAEFEAAVDAFIAGLPAGTKLAAVNVADNMVLLYGGGIEGVSSGVTRTAVDDADHDVADGDVLIAYTAITAGRAVNLPAAADAGEGRTLIVKDEAGAAGSFAISVTPDGAEEIDGTAAAVDVAVNYGFLALYCDGTGWFTLGARLT